MVDRLILAALVSATCGGLVVAQDALAQPLVRVDGVTKLHRGKVLVPAAAFKGHTLKGSFSLAFGIRARSRSRGWANILHKGRRNVERGPAIWFYPSSTRLHIRVGTGRRWNYGGDPGQTLPLGRWVSVVLVFSGSEMRVYYDGRLVLRKSRPGDATGNPGPLYASDPWHAAANAELRDVRIYTRALRSKEVAALTKPAPPPEKPIKPVPPPPPPEKRIKPVPSPKRKPRPKRRPKRRRRFG